MKKKLIQSLMLLIVAVSVGSFVSCKDTNEDMYNQLNAQTAIALSENASLKQTLEEWKQKLLEQIAKYEALEEKLNSINSCTCTPVDLTDINNALNTINGRLDGIDGQIVDITADYNVVKNSISGMQDEISALESNINAQLLTITGLLKDLENLQSQTGDNTAAIAALTDLINGLKNQVVANETLLSTLTNLPSDVANQQALIATLQAEIAALKAWKEQLNTCNCENYTDVLTLLAKLQQEMTDAKDKVDAAIANATNLANAAQNAANAAQNTANDAQTAAANAQGTASTAKAIAEAATAAAQNALEIAQSIDQKADQANMTASAAKDAADKAWELATQALTAANSANSLATQLATRIEALEGLVSTNTSNIAANQEAIAANKEAIAANKAAIEALQTATETIRTLINDNKTELLAKIAELKTELSDKIDANGQKIDENRLKILENAANIASNSEKIALNAQNIAQNAKDIKEAMNQISALSSQISAMNEKISLMSQQIQEALAKASEAAGTATANSLEIATLKQIVQNLQSQIDDLKNSGSGSGSSTTNPVSTEEFNTLKETVEGLKTTIQNLNQDLLGKINGNTTEIEKLKTALESLTTAAGKTDETLEDLIERVNGLLDRLSTLEGEVEILRTTCDLNLYATKEYANLAIEAAKNDILLQVKEMLKEYLKSGDVDLSNYVTKEEVANFIAREELKNYATKDELNDIKNDLAGLVSQDVLDALLSGINDKISGLNDKMDGVTEVQAALQVALENLTTEMTNKFLAQESTIGSLKERIAKNEADIAWLKELYNTLNSKLGLLEENVGELGTSVSNLENWKEQIENWKAQIEEWKASLPDTTTDPNEIYEIIKEKISVQIAAELNAQILNLKQDIINELQLNLNNETINTIIINTIINNYNFVTQDQIEGLAQALIQLAELKEKVENMEDYGDRITDLETQMNNIIAATAGLAELIERVNILESTALTADDLVGYVKLEDLTELLKGYATKDDLEGLATSEELEELIDALENYATKQELRDYANNMQSQLGDLKQDLLNLKNDFIAHLLLCVTVDQLNEKLSNYYTRDDIDGMIDEINDKLDDIEGKFDGYYTKDDITEILNNYFTQEQINSMLNEINSKFDGYYSKGDIDLMLSNYVTKDMLDDYATKDMLNDYVTVADLLAYGYITNDDLITKLADYLTISQFNQEKEVLLNKISANTTAIGDIRSAVSTIEGRLDGMDTEISGLKTRVTATETRLDDLEEALDEAVSELQTEISAIQDFLAKQVTSIIVQGTKNPMFGTFSLPADIQSNVLIAYYGVPFSSFEFPTDDTAPYGERADQALTTDELDMLLELGLEPFEQRANMPLLYENGNAGKVYMTINPNTADLEGLELSLVNTQDKESPIKLKPIRKSNEKLQFGYTRANNGFYEADAYVTNQTVMTESNGIPLTKEDIKTAFSNIKEKISAILNRTSDATGGLQIGQIASDVYNVINKMKMDRTGLKCTYTTTDASGAEQKHSVYSEYNLGATFINPLSLNYGKDFNYQTMPGYETVRDFFKNIVDKAKDKIHTAFTKLNESALIQKIQDFKIIKIELKDLDPDLVAKFEITIGDEVTIDGLTYHMMLPADASINVKYAPRYANPDGSITNLTVNGTPVTVPSEDVINPADPNVESATIVIYGDVTSGADGIVPMQLVIPVTHDAMKKYVWYDMSEVASFGSELTDEGVIVVDNTNVAQVSGSSLNPLTSSVTLSQMLDLSSGTTPTLKLEFTYDLRDEMVNIWGQAQGVIADVNKMLQDVKDILKEFNTALDQINSYEGKIDNTIDNAYENYIMKYLDKANNFVVGFVNSINRRLQPFMVASTNKGFKRVSTVRAIPTVLSPDVVIYPTTKNMELIVPIARKHVAVTNVFKGNASAQGGDSDCMDKLEAVNTGELNKVFDGNKRKLEVSNMVSGYVYEIAYSVLDFDGNMSTHRYYIRVE